MRTLVILSIALWWGVTASAQTLNITVSASVPFTAAGVATEGLSATVDLRTTWEGWKLGGKADLALLPFALQ